MEHANDLSRIPLNAAQLTLLLGYGDFCHMGFYIVQVFLYVLFGPVCRLLAGLNSELLKEDHGEFSSVVG